MPIITNLEDKILQLVRSNQYQWFTVGVNLGGVSGEAGGSGIPLGGFIGQLIQSKVTFDTTEAATLDIPTSGASLVDNLNRIRYWINTMSGGAGAITFLELTDTPSGYAGYSGFSVVVNETEDGLEFLNVSGGAGTDTKKILVSANDTTENYLEDKVVAGTNVTVTTLNDGSDETLQIAATISGGTEITADNVLMDTLDTPTYTNLENWFNTVQSAGVIWGGITTDNLDGTVAVASGRGIIKTTDSHLGANLFFDWTTDSNVTLTNDSTNFVYIDYNDGSPTIASVVALSSINLHTQILVSRAYREDTDVHIWNVGQDIADYFKEACLKDFEVFGPSRAEGLVIGEIGTRNLTMTTGILYCAHNRTTQSALDTSDTDTFTYWYRDSGVGWTQQTSQTQINNDKYDDGDGTLGDLTANSYTNAWVYVLYDGTLHVQYGQENGNLISAISADVPSPPTLLSDFGLLLAKIVIQEGEASFTDLQTAFETTFSTNATPDHGDLAGLADDDHTQYALADGSRTFDLDELENVTVTTPQDGEALVYDSGTWVNDTVSGGAGSSYTYALEDVTGQIPAGGDNYTLAATPASGALVLHFNGLTQQPNNYNISGAGFHTLFSPESGDELVAEYYTDVPSESILGLTLEVEDTDVSVATNVEVLNFKGMEVTDEGGGKVTISGGIGDGGGASLTVQEDDSPIVTDVTVLNFEGGAEVTDEGSGKATITISGGVGGGGTEPDFTIWMPKAPPTSPSAYDDEFDDETLDGKWSTYDEPSVQTETENKTGLIFSVSSADNFTGIYQDVVANYDWTIITHITMHGNKSNDSVAGLMLLEDTDNLSTSDVILFGAYLGSSGLGLEVLYATDYSGTGLVSRWSSKSVYHPTNIWLRIRAEPVNTWYFDYSIDGVGWVQVHANPSRDFAPEGIGVGVKLGNTTIRGISQLFRYVSGYAREAIVAGNRVDMWRA